ncbi:fungal-specific transcription factor domain-containing protein [Lineolata rhizophorae]|uniref:Fungal-specific transcription factor domain-containing protein n=1 Tax=Lineolata rhizophorae TaxID=578093 RepID=A0A6A6P555_9PEZI|nr:fungal-specific transcription factor domain-containing protein [Lineolata rhizophorae]
MTAATSAVKRERPQSQDEDGQRAFHQPPLPPPPPPPPRHQQPPTSPVVDLTAKPSPSAQSPTATASTTSSAASFRNVSACNRCRLRKNRCDQRLPACASCEKANVKCVGYDPITKREIPRSYVYYLESRIEYLERLLDSNGIAYTPPENFALSFKPAGSNEPPLAQQHPATARSSRVGGDGVGPPQPQASTGAGARQSDQYEREKLNKLVSNIGMVSVQGASDPRYLGSTSGISFARVVFAAVKSSVSGASSERGSIRGATKTLPGSAAAGGTTMRDSFFGLQTKPTIRQAPFPDREVGLKLVELFFEHANPQIPILHRGEFMSMFDRVYAAGGKGRTARESYMLNIVFAIGSGIILGRSESGDSPSSDDSAAPPKEPESPPLQKKRRLTAQQHQPEEYHASAIIHLESFLGSSPAVDRPDGFGGGLEELQAVLLLASFALLRPVAPGLWYIVGVAVRLGVDLGLHYEDGTGIDSNGDESAAERAEDAPPASDDLIGSGSGVRDAKERGRRQWVRDLRRRLWWCVYTFDRLVSTCVGRPFGIADEVVTTEFPSVLDDAYITPAGFTAPPNASDRPSYKRVSHHYFRLRLLQSEILQVLQYRQAQAARAAGANQTNEFMHTKTSSPFLIPFRDNFRSWRADIDRRLWEWKESAPTQLDTGVQFSPLFLDLNYWQAVIMLYRQSLSVPPILAGELGSTNEGVTNSPSMANLEDRDDEEGVFLKVAEAGQKVLKIYRQLHRVHLVNYTYLATHHLFMAGISFLYAIWHSPVVRSKLSLDDVDFTVLAATSVLQDLMEKCPPAEACRDAFDRMSKATISMCLSTTGFGPQALARHNAITNSNVGSAPPSAPLDSPATFSSDTMSADLGSEPDRLAFAPTIGTLSSNSGTMFTPHSTTAGITSGPHSRARPQPRFDMNLRDLFGDDEAEAHARSFGRVSTQLGMMRPPPQPSEGMKGDATFSPALGNFESQRRAVPQQQPSQHSPFAVTSSMPYTQFAQATSQSSYPGIASFSDLDFLDSLPMDGQNGGGGNGNSGIPSDLDLGFNIGGWDGQVNHDWENGGGFDLFDGFFFGGSGSGGSS